MAKSPYAWKIGDVLIGRYEIDLIFTGGMGVVYRVHDRAWGRYRALKTFQERFIWNRDVSRRFLREAETWVQLGNHPNVVRAESVEMVQGRPCLILEWVEGKELKDLIDEQGALSLEQGLSFAIQMAEGMAYAQDKLGLVHRDLKPSNVMVTGDGVAKITDFGVAKALYADEKASRPSEEEGGLVNFELTCTGAFLGSIQFMSPEQFIDPSNVRLVSDIYSFGCCLYQMFTTRLPFDGKTIEEFRHKHLHQVPDTPRMYNHDLPRSLANLILRCLEKDPGKRFSSFHAVRDVLVALWVAETEEPWESVVLVDDGHGSDQINRGISMENLGRLDEALRCYEEAMGVTTNPGYLEVARARVLAKLGRFEEALSACDEGLEVDPTLVQALNDKGVVLQQLRRFEEALDCRNQVLATDPSNVVALIGKGCVLMMLKRLDEALAAFDRALEINPRQEDAWQNKGYCLEKSKRRPEALVCYEKALEINPRAYRAWYNKGIVEARLNRLIEALTSCKRALEIDDSDPELWTMAGSLLAEQFQWDDAIEHFDAAIQVDPAHVRAWYNRGVAFESMGDYRESARSLRRAHGLEADNLLVKNKLDSVEARLKKGGGR